MSKKRNTKSSSVGSPSAHPESGLIYFPMQITKWGSLIASTMGRAVPMMDDALRTGSIGLIEAFDSEEKAKKAYPGATITAVKLIKA